MPSSIYKITNLVNNKIYIGYTTRNINTRFVEHCKNTSNKQMPICKAIKKYGKENFKIETICCGDFSLEGLKFLEQHYIHLYVSFIKTIGYNATKGGDSPNLITKEEWKSGKYKSRAGKNNPMYGRIRKGEDNHSHLKKTIYQYDLNWNFIKEWFGINAAARELGIHGGGITGVLNNQKPTYKGYRWSYTRL